MTFTIRTATPDDRDAILALVEAAFTNPTNDGQLEVGIVSDTWALDAAPDGLELVAVDGGAVVGHVLAAIGDLDGRAAPGIAPLSVAPAQQGRGVGKALMTEVLSRADAAGWPLVVLLGNPAYYERFGFEASGRFGIVFAPVGADNPHFMVRTLSAYEPSVRGTYAYCWELPT